jgi:transposase-like protein
VVDRPELPAIQITDVRTEVRPVLHTAEERHSILDRIGRDLANGQTLAASCRQAGIGNKTYRRWYRQQPTLAPADLDVGTSCKLTDEAYSELPTIKMLPRASAKLLRSHDRDKLYLEVWSKPLCQLAKQYGVWQVTLWRICRKLHIPLPARGHWRRSESGLPVQSRPPLPEIQIIDEHKDWKSNAYSLSETALKSQSISDAVSGGKTLEEACRTNGIAVTTYRRWCKHLSGIENQEPARLLQNQDAPRSL